MQRALLGLAVVAFALGLTLWRSSAAGRSFAATSVAPTRSSGISEPRRGSALGTDSSLATPDEPDRRVDDEKPRESAPRAATDASSLVVHVLDASARMIAVGRVVDVEGAPLAGARVSVSSRAAWETLERLAGTGLSQADGSFAVPCADRDGGPLANGAMSAWVRADKPGFFPSETVQGQVWEGRAVGGRFEVGELVLRAFAFGVCAEVVDARGAPVPEAVGSGTMFEWDGQTVANVCEESGADGRFCASVGGTGKLALLVVHPEFGAAFVEGEITAQQPLLDAGRVVLTPRGQIAGTLVAAGGQPLARIGIQAENVADPFGNSPTVETDADGRFRFAYLDPGEHRLRTRLDEQEWSAVPDALGLAVRLLRPRLLIEVLDPGAAPEDDGVRVVVRRVAPDDSGGWNVLNDEPPAWLVGPGRFQALATAPGMLSIEASSVVEGVPLSASVVLDVGWDGAEVRLALAPRRE